MSILYGKGGVESGSRLSGVGGLKSGSPVYGDGGEDSGSIIYGGYGDKHATRNIPTFDGTNYGTLDTPITFTGDFEVTAEAATTTDDASFDVVVGGANHWFGADNVAGKIAFNINGYSNFGVTPVTIDPFDGKIHTWKVTRVGTTISVYIDDILQDSGVGAGGSISFSQIGSNSSSSFWQGQILSAKFTDAGTVVTNFVFDSGSTTDQPSRGGGNNVTLVNFTAANWNRYTLQRNIAHDTGTIGEAWIGDNLVINGTFDTDTDWTKEANWSIANGVATHSVGGGNNIYQTLLTIGLPYLLTFEIIRLDAGTILGYIGISTPSTAYSTTGTKKFFDICAGNGRLYIFGGAASDADVDNVIINHILEVA